MLFSQIFNWVKYKITPSSLLFKNRLFIERQSKTKNIYTNFGLLFRNNKWASFSQTNLNINFALPIFFILLFFFICKTPFVNFVSFLLWVVFDTYDYYSSFLIWLGIASYSICLNSLYAYFFVNNLIKVEKSNISFRPTKSPSQQRFVPLSTINVKNYLYIYLKNPQTPLTMNFQFMFAPDALSFTRTRFFCKLYQTLWFLRLHQSDINYYILKQKLNFLKMSNVTNFNITYFLSFNLKHFQTNYTSPLLYYLLKNNQMRTPYIHTPYTSFLHQQKKWSYSVIQNAQLKTRWLQKNKLNNFYMTNYTLEIFKSFIFNFPIQFNLTLLDQNNFLKWHKWLAKYSILHKNTFKHVNQINNLKFFLNKTSFSNQLFKKNIWISEFFKKNETANPFITSSSSLASLFLSLPSSKLTQLNTTQNMPASLPLNFYQTSLYFFLKRFYFFNALGTNQTTTTLTANTVLNQPLSLTSTFGNTQFKNKTIQFLQIPFFYDNFFSFSHTTPKLSSVSLSNNSNNNIFFDSAIKEDIKTLLSYKNLPLLNFFSVTDLTYHTQLLSYFNMLNYTSAYKDLPAPSEFFYLDEFQTNFFNKNSFFFFNKNEFK